MEQNNAHCINSRENQVLSLPSPFEIALCKVIFQFCENMGTMGYITLITFVAKYFCSNFCKLVSLC